MIEELADLLRSYTEQNFRDVLIGAPGRIEKFDGIKMVCDVAPLLTNKDENGMDCGMSILPDVPVLHLVAGGFYVRPEYRKGDIVFLAFATHPFENALASGGKDGGEGRIFSPENAVVMGSLKTKTKILPNYSKSGLIAGHESGRVFVRLTDSSLTIETDGTRFEFSKSGFKTSGDVTVLSDSKAVSVANHIHTEKGAPGETTSPPL